jgi:peptidoglycan-associated lipoprotein
MFLKSKCAVFAAMFSLVLAAGCTEEPKKVEEAVKPAGIEQPASPDTVAFNGENIFYAFDDYSLSAEAQGVLNKLADHLKANSKVAVQIEGHCDERGSVEYNLALGERRANSAKNYLVQLGVEAARLSTISYGEERPSTEGHDEAAWAKNRRAQFVLSAQ